MEKNFIDKLAFIDIKNRKILVSLSKGKGTWYIPGGKREENETDIEALTREIKEELSVDVIEKTITLYGIFEAQAHGKQQGITVRMTCYTALYKGTLTPSSKIEKIDYFSYKQKYLCSIVDSLIFEDLRKKDQLD